MGDAKVPGAVTHWLARAGADDLRKIRDAELAKGMSANLNLVIAIDGEMLRRKEIVNGLHAIARDLGLD